MEFLDYHFRRINNTYNMKFEPHIRSHLAKVYGVLASATAATAVGSMSQMYGLLDFGSWAAIASLLLVLSLHFYQDNGKNYYTRLGMLLGFGFCSGQSLGPLLTYALHINSSILLTALAGTTITFVSLSLAAMFAQRGKFLYLGGILMLVINTMAVISLMNLFLKVYFVQLAQLYIGVIVMAAFVLFDTQAIIEKRRAGDRDVIRHAMDLFFDVLSMFRRLIILLTHKEERKREERHDRHKRQ